jgi:signal transduction histidine kinase
MKNKRRLQDTIGRRFAFTIGLAVAVALALNGLFVAFSGFWGRPPIDQTGLLQRADDLVRVVEAVPVEVRESIANAGSNAAFRVDWYSASSMVAVMLDTVARLGVPRPPNIQLDETRRRMIHFDSGNPMPSQLALRTGQLQHDSSAQSLSVELKDGSWIVFTAPRRTWGLGPTARISINLSFLLLSTVAVSTVAAYQLSRPIRQFAAALRRFGADPRASPVPETGPRELREALGAFNGMQAQIQKFVDDRTTMLAAISHDLRTPLTKIRLRGEYITEKRQQTGLFQDVDSMQAMVDSALSFFRDDLRDEETTVFDFAQLMRTITDDYSDQGREVPYTGPEHAPFRGRPIALKRALTNLIDNAVRHGGSPEAELLCAVDRFSVLVRDKGPGIPDEMSELVFRPFYRVEPSRNRASGGVGLGLTSARTVIRGHGGDIVLRNRPSGGLEVEVTLPMASR